ncbi:pilus assembly protein PilY [Collimonas pratensis]|uniref:pilus assembly protein n=1 Tax=Collimonas pratensis TaxID=279113 RepID=UPI00143D44EF|nr:PilC/PilY family type IV pilus protein [Collimonas pratensis]NKI70210.1 pilus assembly protein PilY [Collimonas pratensis]
MKILSIKNMVPAAFLVLPCISDAIVVTDNFTQSAAQNSWTASGGACLTAGNDSPYATGISVIPACAAGSGGATGTLPDASGNGALRLTNNQGFQHGSIVYNASFPTDQGIQATFTTYVYNGSKDGPVHLGADGISFFLLDGSLAAPGNVGAAGGSLGYSCSNVDFPYDGVAGGYIGLGLDEWGNFSTGRNNSTATGGPRGYTPNSIVLRGGGSITASNFKQQGYAYGDSDIAAACKSGRAIFADSGRTTAVLDYPYITGTTLPVHYPLQTGDIPMAQSYTMNRTNAIPITYKLKITPSGLLSLWYSYNGGAFATVITNKNILDPTVSGPLPTSFRFGFSGGTGGSTNIHEISCFMATPANVSSSSGGINAIKGAKVQVGTQVYFASYHPDNWWGQMTANSIVVTAGVPSISPAAAWDGNCNLTGGSCTALATDADGAPRNVTAQTMRTVLTSDGSGAGTPFTWENGITAAQKAALNVGPGNVVDTNGQIRLNYLRGDRTQEQPVNSLRQRTGVLGDIIDSSPTWIGPPNKNYQATWADRLYPASKNPEASYPAFVASAAATRTNVVYVGSNDGMVHGFQAGSYNKDGTYNTANNDGKDVLDYLPASVLANLPAITDPLYSHRFYANSTPATGDLFYGGAWHTWLVGGLGAGGRAIYALDVTDPTQFKETNASALVIGEWTDSTLAEIGNTYGTPIIRRMHNGQWAVIFGNGFNSANGKAGIYIMTVDPVSGAQTFNWLPTGVGTSARPDGIAYVASADLDRDHVVDYLYAGDMLGNVWRFDVTSSNTADWGVSKYGQSDSAPLFTARDSGGTAQPITTQIQVTSVPVGTKNRVLLMFATGKKTSFTSIAADIYATGTQSVYGVWDWDMSNWNKGMTTTNGVVIPASGVQYASLAEAKLITRRNLTAQTMSSVADTSGGQVLGYRTLSNNTVCWQGEASCSTEGANNQFGWRIDLPLTGEQVIYNPVVSDGALELNTTIPPASGASSCSISAPTGWTMAFNPLTGGTFARSYFPNSTNNLLVMGNQLNAAGSPGTTSVGSSKYIFEPNTSGTPLLVKKDPPTNMVGKRITWKQTQ